MQAKRILILTIAAIALALPSIAHAHGGPRIVVGFGAPCYPRPYYYYGYHYYAPMVVAPPPVMLVAPPPVYAPAPRTYVAPPPATLPPTAVAPTPFTPPPALPITEGFTMWWHRSFESAANAGRLRTASSATRGQWLRGHPRR